MLQIARLLTLALALAMTTGALAQVPGFSVLESSQNAANAAPGPRTLPAKTVPVPQDIGPAAQALVAAPYRLPAWNANPASAEEWRALVKKLADASLPALAKARETLGVTLEPTAIGGVEGFVFTPKSMPDAHRNQLIINVHGGGYVYGPGEAGTAKAMLMAAYGGYKVIEFDYRMPPDAPYPAAMDDAMAVWKAARAMQDPSRMAIVGTSTGAGMTLAMILRAKQEGLALPAAIAPGTPWADLTETGRQLQDKRVAGQRSRQLQWIPEPRCGALCERPRHEGSAALANLWRLPWLSARDPDQRNAGSVSVKHRPNPSKVVGSRCGGLSASVRGFVSRTISLRPNGSRYQSGVRRNRRLLGSTPRQVI
jgi:acetyl esterase/lipase